MFCQHQNEPKSYPLRFLNVFFEKHANKENKKDEKVNNYIRYQLYVRIINLFRHVLLISILFHLSIQWSRKTSEIAARISGIVHIIAQQLSKSRGENRLSRPTGPYDLAYLIKRLDSNFFKSLLN